MSGEDFRRRCLRQHNTNFQKKLEAEELNIPKMQKPQGFDEYLLYSIIGDGAFPLKPHLMKPYEGWFQKSFRNTKAANQLVIILCGIIARKTY